ncbi:hypothetical protein, partial [Neisseria viridiae]
AHGKSPKCLGGNLGDFGGFCKGLDLGILAPDCGKHGKLTQRRQQLWKVCRTGQELQPRARNEVLKEMPSESLICTPKVGLNRQLIKVQVFLIQYKQDFRRHSRAGGNLGRSVSAF